MGSLVEIRRTMDLGEAPCIKAFLNARGIYVLVQNEHHITQSGGMFSVGLGGFRIVVAAEDGQKRARRSRRPTTVRSPFRKISTKARLLAFMRRVNSPSASGLG